MKSQSNTLLKLGVPLSIGRGAPKYLAGDLSVTLILSTSQMSATYVIALSGETILERD
jgi:hypothetical protein